MQKSKGLKIAGWTFVWLLTKKDQVFDIWRLNFMSIFIYFVQIGDCWSRRPMFISGGITQWLNFSSAMIQSVWLGLSTALFIEAVCGHLDREQKKVSQRPKSFKYPSTNPKNYFWWLLLKILPNSFLKRVKAVLVLPNIDFKPCYNCANSTFALWTVFLCIFHSSITSHLL